MVAISSCLAGNAVRYDGSDKRLTWLDRLRTSLELAPFCPETAAGLGVPRPPVRLVLHDGRYRAAGRDQPLLDVTEPLLTAAEDIALALEQAKAVGVIFKSRSPSCGLGSTPAFARDGQALGNTSGLAAAAITGALPGLLAVEESALQTPADCDRMVSACQLAAEWRTLPPDLVPRWLAHYARQFGLPIDTIDDEDPWRYLLRRALVPWLLRRD